MIINHIKWKVNVLFIDQTLYIKNCVFILVNQNTLTQTVAKNILSGVRLQRYLIAQQLNGIFDHWCVTSVTSGKLFFILDFYD